MCPIFYHAEKVQDPCNIETATCLLILKSSEQHNVCYTTRFLDAIRFLQKLLNINIQIQIQICKTAFIHNKFRQSKSDIYIYSFLSFIKLSFIERCFQRGEQ